MQNLVGKEITQQINVITFPSEDIAVVECGRWDKGTILKKKEKKPYTTFEYNNYHIYKEIREFVKSQNIN